MSTARVRDLAAITAADDAEIIAADPGPHARALAEVSAAASGEVDVAANSMGRSGVVVDIKGFSSAIEENNSELRAVLLDIEELIENTGEIQAESIRTAQATLRKRIEASDLAIQQYDDQYREASSSLFNTEELMNQLILKLPPRELDAIRSALRRVRGSIAGRSLGNASLSLGMGETWKVGGASGRSPRGDIGRSLAGMDASGGSPSPRGDLEASMGNSARSVNLSRSRQKSIGAESVISATPSQVEDTLDAIRELTESFRPGPYVNWHPIADGLSRLFAHNCDDIIRGLIIMRKVLDTDPSEHVSKALIETEKPMTERELLADEAVERAKAAPLEGKEARFAEAVDALERALDLAYRRAGATSMAAGESSIRGQALDAKDKIEAWLERERPKALKLKGDCIEEGDLVDGRRAEKDADNAEAVKAWNEVCDRFRTDNQRVADEQSALWDQIVALIDQIAEKSAFRKTLIDDHVKKTHVEATRVRHYDEWCAVADRHRQRLSSGEAIGRDRVSTADHIQDQLDKLLLELETKSFEHSKMDRRQAELGRFIEIFKKYAHWASILSAHRDARLIVVKREANIAGANAKLIGSANPDETKAFSARATDAKSRVADLETHQDRSEKKMDFWTPRFHQLADIVEEIYGEFVDDPAQDADEQWDAIVTSTRQAAESCAKREKDQQVHDDDEADVERRETETEYRATKVRRSSPSRNTRGKAAVLVGAVVTARKRGSRASTASKSALKSFAASNVSARGAAIGLSARSGAGFSTRPTSASTAGSDAPRPPRPSSTSPRD